MKTTENTELLEALLTDAKPVYHPNTGEKIPENGDLIIELSPSARAGLEAPRYCQICGRRIVVQIRPDGWDARCSRHGSVDSKYLHR
ncbi:biotin synthase auxiliary protein BsaP [Corynebacterium epidermidicanis]|uniref:Biotin synthase auxiliary protein n=1 Tax=Corynebacterium epidermidicanis TaxID=1050174 RepID=A0A0G3GQR6_9CORY|nr:hypothetical protein [Corynebacterium epidermidicanis]AKK03479.1 hypothetical protein CEPID_08145 [Corynebacterium epidermidicanis]